MSPDSILPLFHYFQAEKIRQQAGVAGAYGIQEWIGYIACTELRGSYFNVMGLPTEPLFQALQPYL